MVGSGQTGSSCESTAQFFSLLFLAPVSFQQMLGTEAACDCQLLEPPRPCPEVQPFCVAGDSDCLESRQRKAQETIHSPGVVLCLNLMCWIENCPGLACLIIKDRCSVNLKIREAVHCLCVMC